jgi:hypothetical protein
VTWVKCWYDSALGKIESDWNQEDGQTSIDIAIPRGATATLILPVKMAKNQIAAPPKANAPKVEEVRRDDQVVVYRVSAGLFHFRESESE